MFLSPNQPGEMGSIPMDSDATSRRPSGPNCAGSPPESLPESPVNPLGVRSALVAVQLLFGIHYVACKALHFLAGIGLLAAIVHAEGRSIASLGLLGAAGSVGTGPPRSTEGQRGPSGATRRLPSTTADSTKSAVTLCPGKS